ncbi:TPA: hypothetical protein KZI03_000609 [Listeria monocytogenes]|nr:hypothetical protein [Listeria monocytogenes]HBI2193249.1 hypothetical protein [Listeria monocytogenes]
MNEALIAAGATLLVCLINNYFQAQQAEKKHNETISLVTYRLEQLEKKQDLHNNAVSRLYEVEKRLGVDEEKIKVVNHRIEDLEQTCDK